jgi:hypothetical protein
MRPPARRANPRSTTPPLPREVLDDIVRATNETPARGMMAGMRGRARELLGHPFLRLATPRGDAAPDDAPGAFEEEEFDVPAAPLPARPAARRVSAARPLPPVVVPPAAKRLADAAPDAWEDEDADTVGPDELPDDGDDPDPPRRFDPFGDSLWPKTRIALTVVALTLVLAVAAAGVARMAGGSPPEQVRPAAAAAPSVPAPAASAATVSDETRRIMDAGLRAAERSASATRGTAKAP